ncbi:MAG: hypothetical protein HUK14_04110 [Muribaculaceae bacterium]|nr:hypothetical protein [Muribaculaceae bacterium]
MKKFTLLMAAALVAAMSAGAAPAVKGQKAAPIHAAKDLNPRLADEEVGDIVATAGENVPLELAPQFLTPQGFGYTQTNEEFGIVTDGNFIYTSTVQWGSCGYKFYKYDMNGNFVEQFNIDDCDFLLDMTFDGTYVYGSNGNNLLYAVDLAAKELISYTVTDCECIIHCSYDPDKDGFWVGSNESLMLIGRDGKALTEPVKIPYTSGTAFAKSPQDERFLWMHFNGYIIGYTLDEMKICERPLIYLPDGYPDYDMTYDVGAGCCSLEVNGLRHILVNVIKEDMGEFGLFYVDDNYDWTNDNAAVGLPASGTGRVVFKALNDASGQDQVANITATPFHYVDGQKEYGTPFSFSITVKPLTDSAMLSMEDVNTGNGDRVELQLPVTSSPCFDFEDGTLQGWTTIDADGDGNNWRELGEYDYLGFGHNTSAYYAMSESFNIFSGPLSPDNYMVAPVKVKATDASYLKYYVTSGDATYADENYAVAVSTAGNTDTKDFEMLTETTSVYGWTEHTVDLSKYAGQEIWVAFRHYNTTDVMNIGLDDITLGNVLGAGASYAWTNDNPSIGLPASGEGAICFDAVNNTGVPQVANITVVPFKPVGEAKAYGTPVSFKINVSTESGIDAITADDNAPAVYFNLNGIQVHADQLLPGIYVRRSASGADKVVVK